MANFAPNGIVDLMSGISWHSDYADVRLFNSITEQKNWFAARPKITFDNCSYTRGSQQFVAVNANIETLWQYNYMRYQNENMGDKWFYAFIDRYEYRAPMTTYVYFTIDVFQTWMFDFSFLESMIEREIGPYSRGDKFFIPESLDYGTDYDVVATSFVDGVGLDSTTNGSYVLVASTIDLGESFGSYENPNVVSASGSRINNLPYGCNFYKITFDKISDFFNGFKNYPWICNGIIGMTIIPEYMTRAVPERTINLGGGSGIMIDQLMSGSNVIATETAWSGNIFSNFPQVSHPKLLMFPYSLIEISCQNGGSLILKPQYVNGQTISILRRNVVGMNPKIKYYLDGYCGDGQLYDFSLSIDDFPQLPLLNVNYLLSSFQTDKLISQGQKLAQADIAFGGINSAIGFLTGSSMGGVGSKGFDLLGAITAGLSNAGNFVSSGLGILQNSLHTKQSIDQMEAIKDRANAQSPTLQTQTGGTSFNYATGQMGVTIRWKMVAEEYRQVLGDYFKRFGVKITRLKTPNIRQMTRFDYLKCADCKISANMPQDDEMLIINACNNGVTFWHDDDIGNYENNGGI